MKPFGLYLVMTDPIVGYDACAKAAVNAGIRMLQLRMKNAPREHIIQVAREIRRITDGTETTFIVNDDPAIAAEVEADGVHVGQDDLSPAEIRQRYPSLKIIGLSTHNLSQVLASREQPIDYIGVGPVYTTPTKAIPDPTLGLETMRQMIAAAAHPAVAIGGIDAQRLPEVVAHGAENVAIVRAVCRSTTPYTALLHLQSLLPTPANN